VHTGSTEVKQVVPVPRERRERVCVCLWPCLCLSLFLSFVTPSIPFFFRTSSPSPSSTEDTPAVRHPPALHCPNPPHTLSTCISHFGTLAHLHLPLASHTSTIPLISQSVSPMPPHSSSNLLQALGQSDLAAFDATFLHQHEV